MSSHSFSAQHNLKVMIVYMTTNIVNGKRYIGQTIQSLEKRWVHHCTPTSGCFYLSNAIKYYGSKNFKLKILAKCNSIDEMNHREQYYIKLFGTLSPNGYNLMTGGGNSKPSEDTLKKRSESLKRYYGSHERKPVSYETRLKISLAGRGRKLSPEHIKKMQESRIYPIFQYSKEGNFIGSYSCGAEASKKLKISHSDIVKCCKNKRRLAGGFQWKYNKTDRIDPIRNRAAHPKRGEGNAPNAKAVALLAQDGSVLKIYNTAKRAALDNKCDHSCVVAVCNKKIKKTKGLVFKYI